MRLSSLVALAALVALGTTCAHRQEPVTPSAPSLDVIEVARRLPAKVKDREGWAEDIVAAIRLTQKEPTAERVCAVVAIIDQESGFQADPVVPDLPRIVRRGLEEKLEPLGPLAKTAVAALLDGTAPGSAITFGKRIDKLRTERDLDLLFRDIAAAYQGKLPGPLSFLSKGSIEDLNPVTTAGSMQVKVSFARELGKKEGLDDAGVRELLYTRGGGVRFGTARLLGYPAPYDDVIYRFADYNAGVYASRNAAFQGMLASVTGMPLVNDGDLLAYDGDEPKDTETNTLRALIAFGSTRGLSASALRRDAKKEKSEAFEDTKAWRTVREVWSTQKQKAAPYARMPDVALSSPKLAGPRTTAWFATNVKKRYDACRARS